MDIYNTVINSLVSNAALIAIVISIITIIFATLKDFILPYIFHPNLKLDWRNDEYCIQTTPLDTIETATGKVVDTLNVRWLRLHITNKGRRATAATNCYVKLLEIKDPNNKIVIPFNPALLTWVQYETKTGHLAKNEDHYIDLVYEPENKRVLCLPKIQIPNSLHKIYEKVFGKIGIYTLRVGVYADNANGKEYEVKVKLTKNFGELSFVNKSTEITFAHKVLKLLTK